MTPTLVLLVVGLTARHLGTATRRLTAFARAGRKAAIKPVIPAVTCSMQASFLTGLPPLGHGIVGNGWLFRDLMEIWLWRQSNRLMSGPKLWDEARLRDSQFTAANLFWWYNMAASHDIGVTPRPIYKADGRKLPDCYTKPADLRDRLTAELGPFPLFQFWGPATSIASSRWIAQASEYVLAHHSPTLMLTYLPHLDYDLQRYGPDEAHPSVRQSLQDIDEVAGNLIDFAQARGRRVIVLSEYGISAVDRPVHINRALREAGFLSVRTEDGGEVLDPVASRAFALADHQLAHIYVARQEDIAEVGKLISSLPGVEGVFASKERAQLKLDHPRSGEIVALADARSWFTYYYWLDDRHAPDFARTVDIHRKLGYDPVELFIDPGIKVPKLAVGARLLARKLGFRTLMDVIPLDAGLVRGSHGRLADEVRDYPLLMSDHAPLIDRDVVDATAVKDLILDAIFA